MFDETAGSLEAEALAATAGAPADLEELPRGAAGAAPGLPAGPAGPTEEEILAGYTLLAGELVDLGAVTFVPAWKVTPAESGKMASALARAALLWFPDAIIPPKYLALITVAGVALEIAQARKDPTSGRYLPAHPTTEKRSGESAAAAAH